MILGVVVGFLTPQAAAGGPSGLLIAAIAATSFLVGGTVGSWVARIQRRREEASLDRCLAFYEQRIATLIYPDDFIPTKKN